MDTFTILRHDFNFDNLDKIIKHIKLEKTKLKYDKSIFLEYEKIINNVKFKYAYKHITNNKLENITIDEYLLTINNMNNNLGYILFRENEQKSIIETIELLKTKRYTIQNTPKFDNIITNPKHFNYNLTNRKLCEIEENLHKQFLMTFGILYYCLNLNGCYLITIINYCYSETIDLIYLLLFLFEKIIIYEGTYIYCEKFNPLLSHKEFINIIKKDFTIINKVKIDKLLFYLINIFRKKNNNYLLLTLDKEDEFLEIYYNNAIE